MASPYPKDPRKRARRNRDSRPFTFVSATRVPQPELPDNVAIDWPDDTRQWWAWWGRSSLSRDFTTTDWEELLIAARLHAVFWRTGDPKVAGELRQRLSKFGATPLDRQRLRIDVVTADAAERRAQCPIDTTDQRQKYGPLRAV